MHLGWRADGAVDDRADGPAGSACRGHLWRRMRDMTHAPPGVYVTEVCAQCGALRIDELDDLLRDLCDGWGGPSGAMERPADRPGRKEVRLPAPAS